MYIDVPRVLNEKPTYRYWEAIYNDPRAARIALKISMNVWRRTRVAEAQNWKCCWCGCKTTLDKDKRNSVTVEHVVPRAEGGTNSLENLALACYACNNNRGITSIEDFIAGKTEVNDDGYTRNDRKIIKRADWASTQDWSTNEHVNSFKEWFTNIKKLSPIASAEIKETYKELLA